MMNLKRKRKRRKNKKTWMKKMKRYITLKMIQGIK